MKYVRVCNEYESEYITTYKQHCEDVADMQDSGFDFEGCIIKQADTIKELCDVWIIIPVDVVCNPLVRNINENISLFINYRHIIYAAIWFKGNNGEPILQPAAKMNEKGELLLL